jgi:hypothetical protein
MKRNRVLFVLTTLWPEFKPTVQCVALVADNVGGTAQSIVSPSHAVCMPNRRIRW